MLERESRPAEDRQDARGAEGARKARTLRHNHHLWGQNDGASQRGACRWKEEKPEVMEEEKVIQADCGVGEDSGESVVQLGDPTSPS